MFTGYTVTREQHGSFDVVPSASVRKQQYAAFRLSDRDGLTRDGKGTGYYIELEPVEVADAQADKDVKNAVHYRVPAVCVVRLTAGGNALCQARIPIYQLGREGILPLK